MALSSSLAPHLTPIDPRIYCETMNELHSYIATCKRGYLTQAELFRYYRQRHDDAEIPYRPLGYRSLLDLLSSDQRLFAIDLRREPAYIYSAVRLRQQKRERRQGSTSFTRQHHSTNTIDEHQVIHPDYLFFDHHVPISEQQQQNQIIESMERQEFLKEAQNECPATTNTMKNSNKNDWYTSQSDEVLSVTENKINSNENHEESKEKSANPCLTSFNLDYSLDNDDKKSPMKTENEIKAIQRKLISKIDLTENEVEDKYHSIHDLKELQFATSPLSRSISTSTTCLSKSCLSNTISLFALILIIITVCFICIGVYLCKIC